MSPWDGIIIDTDSLLPACTTGVSYSVQLSAHNGEAPYTWSIVSGSLPSGLSLSPNGHISGTASASGTYQVTIRAEDSVEQRADGAFTLVVASGFQTSLTIYGTEQVCDSNGTKAQLLLTFDCVPGKFYVADTPYVIVAEAYGIMVESWGKLKWEYNLEDMLLVPGEASIVLTDSMGILDSLFFGDTVTWDWDNKTIQNYFLPKARVEIKLNGQTEYIGYTQEDGIDYDSDAMKVSMKIDPNTQILNMKLLYNDDGSPINPFNYSRAVAYPVTKLLEDIFRLVDDSIRYNSDDSVTDIHIIHDWIFRGREKSPGTGINNSIPFSSISVPTGQMYFESGAGLSNVGDVLKKLAIDYASFTGMIHAKKAFFKKLYTFDPNNTQELGTVQSHKKAYKFCSVDYVELKTPTGATGVSPFIYKQGTNTKLDGRSIKRTIFNVFYDANEYANGVSFTDVEALIDGVRYYIYSVIEPALYLSAPFNLFGGQPTSYGNVLSWFWHHFRGDSKNNRVDTFTVDGVQYEFLKDFTHDGGKYQPIGLEKDIDEGTSVFQALYLGEL